MMSIKIDRNSRKVIIKIKHLKKDMNKGIRRGFYLLGVKLQKDTKKDILRKPRSGEIYIVRTARRRRRHTASSPGEAPASISGRLWRSLDFRVSGSKYMRFGYDSTAKTDKGFEYGKHWESEADASKLRPGLLINIEKNKGFAIRMFDREIKKALK